MENNQITSKCLRTLEPEKYFQDVLEGSEFDKLKKLVDDSDGAFSWRKLKLPWIISIVDKKVNEIWWEEDLTILFSNLKSLRKVTKVNGNVVCASSQILEDLGDLEEIEGNLDVRSVSIKLQLDIIEKVNSSKLKVKGLILFGRGGEGVEELLNQDEIPGEVFINGLPIDLQLETLYRKISGKLKVGHLYSDIDEKNGGILEDKYQDGILKFDEFRKSFGESIVEIEDEKIRFLAVEMLLKEYKRVKIETKKEGEKIMEENRGKSLSEKEKRKLRDRYKILERKVLDMKEKIESLGVTI